MSNYKECPYCAEQILNNDITCKHCNSMLVEKKVSAREVPLPPSGGTGTIPPPPPPPAAEAATVPPASKAQETGANSFNTFIRAVTNLFSEGEFSAPKLAQVESSSSITIVAAAGLLGPLLSMLFALVNSSGAGGIFGRLFVNIFIASSLSNLFSLAVLFGLLYAWFEIRKEEISINAHLALTALVAVILFGAGLLALIVRFIPWLNMGYVLVALVVYRYSNETYKRKAILDPLAVLAAWLLINSVIVNRLIGFIF